jgi:hypothetical protein
LFALYIIFNLVCFVAGTDYKVMYSEFFEISDLPLDDWYAVYWN